MTEARFDRSAVEAFLIHEATLLDDREFDDARRIDFRREGMRHTTFAVGPHRCIGSHLARRELKIAIDLVLDRIPTFRIKPGEHAVTHATGVFGVDYLPLSWG